MHAVPSPTTSPSRILVVVAHPDDEVLGCGATIARFVEEGCEVRVLLALRPSFRSRRDSTPELLCDFRRCCEILGCEAAVADPLLDEREAELSLRELHDAILPHVEWCDTVLSHWIGDVHQAHRGVARAVEVATRPFRRRRQVLSFEIATSTDQSYGLPFMANSYVIAEARHVDQKREAFSVYSTEITPGRSLADITRKMESRGSEIGTQFAEAFVLGRMFI